MNARQISIVSLILALLMQKHGRAVSTFEEAYEFVIDPGTLFYLTYWNVVVLG